MGTDNDKNEITTADTAEMRSQNSHQDKKNDVKLEKRAEDQLARELTKDTEAGAEIKGKEETIDMIKRELRSVAEYFETLKDPESDHFKVKEIDLARLKNLYSQLKSVQENCFDRDDQFPKDQQLQVQEDRLFNVVLKLEDLTSDPDRTTRRIRYRRFPWNRLPLSESLKAIYNAVQEPPIVEGNLSAYRISTSRNGNYIQTNEELAKEISIDLTDAGLVERFPNQSSPEALSSVKAETNKIIISLSDAPLPNHETIAGDNAKIKQLILSMAKEGISVDDCAMFLFRIIPSYKKRYMSGSVGGRAMIANPIFDRAKAFLLEITTQVLPDVVLAGISLVNSQDYTTPQEHSFHSLAMMLSQEPFPTKRGEFADSVNKELQAKKQDHKK